MSVENKEIQPGIEVANEKMEKIPLRSEFLESTGEIAKSFPAEKVCNNINDIFWDYFDINSALNAKCENPILRTV